MKKLLTEFIGTFFLVFTVGMTVINPGAGAFAPLAIGITLMVMVYAGGHVSGGHYNPAVTLGVWLRGGSQMKVREVIGYMAAQLLGAAFAATLTVCLKDCGAVTPAHLDVIPALIAEIVGAFALVYVVLNTATARATSGNSYYGLAIGLTVTTMAYTLGSISGGAFNPAVAVGISALSIEDWSNIWVYIIGNFSGAALAAIVFRYCVGK